MGVKQQGQPSRGKGGAAAIRKDARGQFAGKQHGGKNDGLDSAAPVVTTGDGDATFDNDPGDDEKR
jgi:hypothetical protein